jgi:outer membrane putative beta-barrel porin/alpha-amylase
MRRLAPLVCVGLIARLQADEPVTLATDRPSVTASSTTVPHGGVQLESGMQATVNGGQWTLDAPELLVRYGLLPKTELRLAVPDYSLALPAGGAGPHGFGDLALAIEQQLGPIAGFDLALIPSISFPTGATSNSSGGYDPGLQLPWSRALSASWTVAGQLASYWPTVAGTRNYTSELTLLFDRQLRSGWDIFMEYAADVPQHGGSRQVLQLGTTYKPSPHHQIDLHAGFGLTQAAPAGFAGIGYSYLYLPR